MKKLLLFDIDGTLLTSFSTNKYTQAINNLHKLEAKSDKHFGGYTDYLILIELLEDQGWDEQQIQEAIPELLKEVNNGHASTFDAAHLTILPGVKNLLENLAQKDVVLGLVTGNLRPIARRKLTALGIWKYFSTGAFGSDPHTTRADVVTVAVKRAGYQDHLSSVYIIGDTPRDVEAANAAGVVSVAVANGLRDPQELRDAGAKIVLEDFKDTSKVLQELGIV
jgi:phosphoglycolate phosphatase-like HAD superfamily hydrolase